MKVLGIESTAHTIGLGLIDHKKIICNLKASYTTKSGGIIPAKSADFLAKSIPSLLSKLPVKMQDIDLISFSQGPGIGQCLSTGAMLARTIALKYNKPIIGVNHCIAHIEIGKLVTKAKEPILLYVSGANTQVIAFEGGKYRIFGETLDMGAGNFLDSFGRALDLGFPAGPVIEKLALTGKYIEVPYTVKGMDVAFGGLLTNIKQKINGIKKEDLCYSVQETIFAMLIEVAERAMAHCKKNELLLGGGVACNKRLQEMANIMCKERNAQCFIPENQYLVDNGVMIAWLGLEEYQKGRRMNIKDTAIRPEWRTDEE
jgi:glycoprotease/Kae1 family metallohydrolase